MAFGRLFGLWTASVSTLGLVAAHGGGHQKPLEIDPNAPWATRHMAGRCLLLRMIWLAQMLNIGL